MYILDITKDIKICQSMKSETLSLKITINELDFSKKINYNLMRRLNKRDLLLLANKLIKKYTRSL